MSQSDTFLTGEGDAWFHRNRDKLGKRDPIGELLGLLPLIRPKRVLEVGCANGWRLHKMQAKYGCRVSGIDTSADAVTEAVAGGLDDICHGKFGHEDPWLGGTFDMIIFGFCLYVTEPRDWFRIMAEADRLLADGGYLVIHDMNPCVTGVIDTHAVPYSHRAGVLSYHVDFAALWLGHPWYINCDESVLWTEGERVSILKKVTNAIPVRA